MAASFSKEAGGSTNSVLQNCSQCIVMPAICRSAKMLLLR